MNEVDNNTFQKKEQLINAAIKEFGEKNYQNASLNNILKEAEVSKGNFYHHFKNKEELYFYIVGIMLQRKKEFLMKSFSPEDLNSDIFTILSKNMKAGFEFGKYNPNISKFSQSFIKERGNDIYIKTMEKYNIKSDDYSMSLIEKAFQKNEFREDLSKDFIIDIVKYFFSNIAEILNTESIDDYERKVDDMIKFLEGGLKKKENRI